MARALSSFRALALVGVATVALTAIASPASAQNIGVVKSVQGEVTIRRTNGEKAAAVGDALYRQDVISTGPDSSWGAILDDGTTISMGSRAGVEITEYAFEPSEGVFELVLRALFGRIVYGSGRIGEARPDRVRIETPFLSVGTRGTRLAVLLPPSAP